MELVTLDVGLLIWTILASISLLFSAIVIIMLSKNKLLNPQTKFVRLLGILFIPFIGSLVYLYSNKKSKHDKTALL